MADGKICKNCGYQETDHDLGRAKLSDGQECFGFDPVLTDAEIDARELRKRLIDKAGRVLIGEINSEWDG